MQSIDSSDALAQAIVANHSYLKSVMVRGVTFNDQNFTLLRFEDSVFEDVKFLNVNFSHTTWEQCRFKNVSFKQCSLEGISLLDCITNDTRLIDVQLRNSSLIRVTGLGLQWGILKMSSVQCLECSLSHVVVTDSTLSNAQFQNCELRNVQVTGTEIEALRISGGSVEDLRFDNDQISHLCIESADITRLRIRACNGKGLSLFESRVLESDISQCVLVASTFTRAVLDTVHLLDNDLSMSNFDQATLNRCRLDRSSLNGALCKHLYAANTSFAEVDVKDADFHAAHLIACDTHQSNFERARPVDHERLAAECWTPPKEYAL